jgi:CHASE2 domain-containing sensor protein
MAAIGAKNSVTGLTTAIMPWPGFRKFSQLALLNGSIKPFSLSVEFPYSSRVNDQIVASASAQIAGRSGQPDVYYRPDWSIQMRTVPTVSFADVAEGRVAADQIRGKDVLVGWTSPRQPDMHGMAGQGWYPGVYFHAVGAQTLREGTPQNWGWVPAIVIAAAFAFLLLRCRQRMMVGVVSVTASVVLLALPFILDAHFIPRIFCRPICCSASSPIAR